MIDETEEYWSKVQETQVPVYKPVWMTADGRSFEHWVLAKQHANDLVLHYQRKQDVAEGKPPRLPTLRGVPDKPGITTTKGK